MTIHSMYIKRQLLPMLKVQVSLLLQLLGRGDKLVYQLRAASQSGGCVGLDAGLQDSEGDDTR